jgi:hypothetical protein
MPVDETARLLEIDLSDPTEFLAPTTEYRTANRLVFFLIFLQGSRIYRSFVTLTGAKAETLTAS